MYRDHNRLYFLTVMGLLAVFAALAIVFGYISPDSWYYMLLAQSLRHGQGCSLHGEYMAVYPCGYPLALALTSPSSDPAVMMISSKITNLLLLGASFWFVWKASKQLFVAALVILNPITLIIAMYTWSENLLLFCFCGVLFALSQLHVDRSKIAPYVVLTLCLIAGCFARYVFGPFAFILFLCAWLAYGRATALRAFPCFCVAGLVFLGYEGVNHMVTGFATGMPRVAAPEAPLLLIRQFIIAVATNGFGMIVVAGLLAGICFRQVAVSTRPVEGALRPASLFIAAAGFGFLALGFVLRLRALFDPYGTRTIGYGIVLLVAGLVGLFVQFRTENAGSKRQALWPVLAMSACAAFSLVYADNGALVQSIGDLFDGDYQFPAASVADLKGHNPAMDVVVFFQLPVTGLDSVNVDNIEEIYYGRDVTPFTPYEGPDNPPEQPSDFLHRLGGLATKRCFFDFTPFASVQDFHAYLDTTTLIDHRLSGLAGPWKTVERPNLAPEMKAYLLDIFQPKQLVSCQDILAMPSSQKALAMPLARTTE